MKVHALIVEYPIEVQVEEPCQLVTMVCGEPGCLFVMPALRIARIPLAVMQPGFEKVK